MAKHYTLDIAPGRFTFTHDQDGIAAEAALDGIYVLRTSVAATALLTADVVRAYKNLAHLERDFRSIKTIDLDLRPIHHYTADRVRAHVLLCALAAYLTWHLRRDLAPLTFTDEHPPKGPDPVAPAVRSAAADRKASRQTRDDGAPIHTFRGLLDHLATLTRNTVRFPTLADAPTIDQLAVPTPIQRHAFHLLDHPIPLTLT